VNPPPPRRLAIRPYHPHMLLISGVWLVFLITEGIFAVQHKFIVGQTVVLMPRPLQPAVPGAYEVLRLMPESDRDGGDPMYRIKSNDEKHERVAAESELTSSA
jgi:hypothetical protein